MISGLVLQVADVYRNEIRMKPVSVHIMKTVAHGQTLPVCHASKRLFENSIPSKIIHIFFSVEIVSDIFVVVSTCRGFTSI
jgi:hypothetical protein